MNKSQRISCLALSLLFFSLNSVAAGNAADYSSTAEYQNSTGLAMIRADKVYALGFTGQGITMGITDEYMRFAHQEFANKYGSYYLYQPPAADYDWAKNDHGSHVGGTMVAARDGIGMHGVAFDANILSGDAFMPASSLAKTYDQLNKLPNLKVINQSWGWDIYLDELIQGGDSLADLNPEILLVRDVLKNSIDHDKLLVFAASNDGHASSSIMGTLIMNDHVTNKNFINVVAANSAADRYTTDANGLVTAVEHNTISVFSDLVKYAEEGSITAPGMHINSAYSGELNGYSEQSGTSMAAPHVSGVAGLVQQAFPYMNSKQIADTLLTSANKTFTLPKFALTVQADDKKLTKVNIYYFGSAGGQTAAGIRADLINYYNNTPELREFFPFESVDEFIDFATGDGSTDGTTTPQFPSGNSSIYYDVPREMVFGQGLLDAYAAIKGPAQLNARRLSAADKDTLYSSSATGQALYKINTQGYNSVWANSISQVQAGLLAGDSSQADLAAIYEYYQQGDKLYNSTSGQEYIDWYNDNAQANGLIDLAVGLYKEGAGILALTGNNTYEGSTIAAAGTIQIDGTVAANAWSLAGANLAGSGKIQGDLINQGTLQAGSYALINEIILNPYQFNVGKLQVQGDLSSEQATIAIASNDALTNSQLQIDGVAKINGANLLGVVGSIYRPDTVYAAFLTANDINGTFAADNVFTGMLSANATISADNKQADLTLKINNNMDLNSNGQKTFGAMHNMYYALNNDSRQEQILPLLSLQPHQASRAISELNYNNTTIMAANIQNNRIASRAITDRLNSANQRQDISLTVPVHGLAASEPSQNTVLSLDFDEHDSWWFRLGKTWAGVNADQGQASVSQNSFDVIVGRDIQVSPTWRVGGLLNYRNNNLSSADGSGSTYDYSLGVYAGYKYKAAALAAYLSAGYQNNTSKRNLTTLGFNTQGKYNSNTINLGLRYTHNAKYAQQVKWAVKPYAALNYTHYRQNSYAESGSGIFDQQVDALNNNYLAGELGLEFVHKTPNNAYSLNIGYKRVLSGANPDLVLSYAGNASNKIRISSERLGQDFLVLDLGVNINMQNNWYADIQLNSEFGKKSQQTGATLTMRKTW